MNGLHSRHLRQAQVKWVAYAGAWTIPKGLVRDGEELLAAARREVKEETGLSPERPFHDLGTVRQKAGKLIYGRTYS